MSEVKFYAHTLEGQPETNWQELEEHLVGVARLAARFAKAFDSESWGYCAGLWHDLGKYQPEFQQRLRGGQVSVEHSGAVEQRWHLKRAGNWECPWPLSLQATTAILQRGNSPNRSSKVPD